MKDIELEPISINPEVYDEIQAAIRRLIREELYQPLMLEVGGTASSLKNAPDPLLAAIISGRIVYDKGQFKGRFDSTLAKSLRSIGAKWDRKQGSFSVPLSKLSPRIKRAIEAAQIKFQKTVKRVDKKLESLVPEEISEKLNVEEIIDKTLWKIEKDFQKTIKSIVVTPKLNPEQIKKVKQEYTTNMQLEIKTWLEQEIIDLRKRMEAHILDGERYEGMIKTIQKKYGVTETKARFLAGQETRLLVSKYKELRYLDAGVPEYTWKCVIGSPNHPVRPAHKALDGKVFRWDAPPIVSEPGQKVRRANAGCDFNCRCHAIPIVRF